MAKFLETITFLGGDMLIPVTDIKCIYLSSTAENYKLVIKCFSDTDTEENFSTKEAYITRYNEIKEILEAR